MNNGIDEMFLHLSQQMMSKYDDKVKNTPNFGNGIRGNSSSGGISIVDDSEVLPPKKSGCCSGGSSSIQEGFPDATSQ